MARANPPSSEVTSEPRVRVVATRRDVKTMINDTTEMEQKGRGRRHLIPANALPKRALAPTESLAVLRIEVY